MRHASHLGAVVTFVLLSACSGGVTARSRSLPTSDGSATRSPTSPPSGALADQWCGATSVRRGAAPDWSKGAPAGLGYIISEHQDVAGFLFADPLVAPPGRVAYKNKILWIVRLPREGMPLLLDGTRRGGAGHVHVERPADSGPGEIYPSIVDVPGPGCWHFSLRWAGHTDEIDLRYVAAP